MPYKRNNMVHHSVYLAAREEKLLREAMSYLQDQRPEQKVTISDAIRYMLYCDYESE